MHKESCKNDKKKSIAIDNLKRAHAHTDIWG